MAVWTEVKCILEYCNSKVFELDLKMVCVSQKLQQNRALLFKLFQTFLQILEI